MRRKEIKKHWKKLRTSVFTFPVLVIVFSLIGLVASAMISIEKTHLLQDSAADTSCSINPVYSCQSVVLSDQAAVFGFSNELIGIAFFGGMLALGLVLVSGGKLKLWLQKLVWLGLFGSMVMVVWFFYQSVYNINALCIYCTTVWFATWTLFVAYSVRLYKQIRLPNLLQKPAALLVAYAPALWIFLILLFAGLILKHFWYYYGQYF